VWQCARQCAAMCGSVRQWAAVSGSGRRCVRQSDWQCVAVHAAVCGIAAVCPSAVVWWCAAARQCAAVRAAMCGSVWQCARQWAAVRAAVCCSVHAVVCSGVTVSDSARGSVRQWSWATVGVAPRAACAALRLCAIVRVAVLCWFFLCVIIMICVFNYMKLHFSWVRFEWK
jgi:hypothetical protein